MQLANLSLNHNYFTKIPSKLISFKTLHCHNTHIPEFIPRKKIDGNPKNYLNLDRQDNFSDNLLLFFHIILIYVI